MKKILYLILIGSMIFSFCSKGNPESMSGRVEGSQPGVEKGPGGGDKAIDIDKLNIPDQMKQAIKNGKIPPDRLREILAAQKGGNLPLVRVTAVGKRALNTYLVLNGTVEPERKVEVYSRLSSFVRTIEKEEGARVKKGEILARLDEDEIRISFQQAKIQLDQAVITLSDEEKNYQRNQELKEAGLISDKDFQTAELNYRKAKLDHDDKLENFKNLQLQLDYTQIASPIDGIVTERLIEVGDRVNTNQQVFSVEDFSPLLVKIFVPASDVTNLSVNMPAHVSTDILKEINFSGRIKLINPRIDVQSGTIKVTVEVEDESMRLKPGMFVDVKIVISNKGDVIAIPKRSVRYLKERNVVFIFDKGVVTGREVETGVTEDDWIEVKKGLSGGEKIVTDGMETLKDGMKVEVR